jgi:hypothetical protein
MRRLSSICSCFLTVCLAWPAVGAEKGNFYFSHGKKIGLVLSDNDVLVKYRGAVPSVVLGDKRTVPLKKNIILQKAQKPSERGALERSPNVLYTSKAFKVPGGWMAPTNEIIVRFSPDLAEEGILRINKTHGAVVKRRLMDGSYVLELKVKRGEDAVAVANQYYALKETLYAHPNFFRSLKIRPQTATSTEMTLGVRLPGDLTAQPATQTSVIGPLTAGSKNLATILKEDFSGNFYRTWQVFDNNGATNGEVYWKKTSVKYRSPDKSVWCAKGGEDGVKPGKAYPNNMDAWMVYGPFSLSDANYAEVTFKTWLKSETSYDYLKWLVSIDGSSFSGYRVSGNWAGAYSWVKPKLVLTDVPQLGDITGEAQAWLALVFSSDRTITDHGAYVDDVKISQFTETLVSVSDDPLSSRQWPLNNIGQNGGKIDADLDVPEAWCKTTGDATIIVAVIDEGVDLGHPDLLANFVVGYDATDQPSGDTAGGQEPSSDDAHGTCCAGIIAAASDNDEGISGIAPGVSMMPVRIGYGNGLGDLMTSDAWIADGINWAWMNGADVLSNSWGGGTPSDTITNAIKNAKNNGRGGLGCVVLFAAGNDDGTVIYPASLKAVVAVGASSPCDQRKNTKSCDGELGWGSNYGLDLDVMAPGVQILTTDISGAAGYVTGDYMTNFNGTSAACPHAAGAVALMLSANPNLTQKQARELLAASADDLSAPGWDKLTGYGRVNAKRAVNKAIKAIE